jgi:hypothetical protein
VTLVAIYLGLIVYPARQKQHSINSLVAIGAEVTFDYQWGPDHAWKPNASVPGSTLLKVIMGEHYSANVVEVQLFAGPGMAPERFDDSYAKQLSRLTEIRWLVLMDTRMSDSGLANFTVLRKLERLDIEGSPVTEKGIAALRTALPNIDIYASEPKK